MHSSCLSYGISHLFSFLIHLAVSEINQVGFNDAFLLAALAANAAHSYFKAHLSHAD